MQTMTCPYCEFAVSTDTLTYHPIGTPFSSKTRCPRCGSGFAFTAVPVWSYSTKQAECLNGAQHDMERLTSYNKTFGQRYRCRDCGELEVVMTP